MSKKVIPYTLVCYEKESHLLVSKGLSEITLHS